MEQLATHPLNRSFSWRDHSGPFRRISAEQARSFDEMGYFVLEDAIEEKERAAIVAEIDPWEARVEERLREQGGRGNISRAGELTFTTHLVRKAALLRRFCSGPPFVDLAHDLLGPDVRLYWDQAVYKKPGTEAPFPWHQDNGYGFVEPQAYLTCWIALTDATETNGCPWIVRGIHRQGTLAHRRTELGLVCLEDPPGAVAAPARAGSIVVFSSLTPHATGANRSQEIRKAYIVQYAIDGTRRLEIDPTTSEHRMVLQDDADRQFSILRRGEAAV
jgi:ectoine hydroxylase-related dioxygenase (phytanoyl-CoA dioxygenase family)